MPLREVIWHIQFQDRVGIGMEVFRCLADHGVSVHSMDANVSNGMILRFHLDTSDYEPLYTAISRIAGVTQVSAKDFMKSTQPVSVTQPSRVTTVFGDIIYTSKAMRRAVETATAAAQTDATILLRGETGTGKELFARAIHAASRRWDGPFIAINCSTLPETLLESELFGYEAGTFTGALRGGKAGLFEEAQGGTLFLDEIGEISPNIQVRLLRILQEHAIRRIGNAVEMPVNVRVISATHQNLEEMIASGQFRQDLYYRLNVIPLHIPPLRHRKEDVYPLVQYLLGKLTRKLNRDVVTIHQDALETLIEQDWPGNVRQLENFIERLLILVPSDEITLEDIEPWLDQGTHNPSQREAGSSIGFHINLQFTSDWPSLREVEEEADRQLLLKVLHAFPSSRKAGNILGVSNTTILNKIKQLNITHPQNPMSP